MLVNTIPCGKWTMPTVSPATMSPTRSWRTLYLGSQSRIGIFLNNTRFAFGPEKQAHKTLSTWRRVIFARKRLLATPTILIKILRMMDVRPTVSMCRVYSHSKGTWYTETERTSQLYRGINQTQHFNPNEAWQFEIGTNGVRSNVGRYARTHV